MHYFRRSRNISTINKLTVPGCLTKAAMGAHSIGCLSWESHPDRVRDMGIQKPMEGWAKVDILGVCDPEK